MIDLHRFEKSRHVEADKNGGERSEITGKRNQKIQLIYWPAILKMLWFSLY